LSAEQHAFETRILRVSSEGWINGRRINADLGQTAAAGDGAVQ